MKQDPKTLRVLVPLTLQKRNGRPRILPPDDAELNQSNGQNPGTLKAIGRAWAWRRQLENGKMGTVRDIARAEKINDSYVSRFLRLAYLSPDVIEALVLERRTSAVRIEDLVGVAELPWSEQKSATF